jgi:hypothetical protein
VKSREDRPITAAERRTQARAEALARSPDGWNEAILLAYGFKIEMLAGLVLDGLATAAPETVPTGPRQLKVVRLMIADAGRGAIAE